MSLQTDSIFIKALQWSPSSSVKSVSDVIKGRLYGTAVPLPEKDLDNEPVPYVVVAFNGLSNGGQTKDNPYEGDSDEVQIGITVTAKTLDELHELAVLIRQRVSAYFTAHVDEDLVPMGYQFTADAIQYDSQKPCYWQTLRYICDTLTD